MNGIKWYIFFSVLLIIGIMYYMYMKYPKLIPESVQKFTSSKDEVKESKPPSKEEPSMDELINGIYMKQLMFLAGI